MSFYSSPAPSCRVMRFVETFICGEPPKLLILDVSLTPDSTHQSILQNYKTCIRSASLRGPSRGAAGITYLRHKMYQALMSPRNLVVRKLLWLIWHSPRRRRVGDTGAPRIRGCSRPLPSVHHSARKPPARISAWSPDSGWSHQPSPRLQTWKPQRCGRHQPLLLVDWT